jgi:hypothetical protein
LSAVLGPVAQALALTSVGNAALRGGDVAGFWPEATVFRFSKSCDFRSLEGERDELIAADPLAWFEMLRAEKCRGLRLRYRARRRGPAQSLPVSERMLAGFVGGGPAWLIEQIGAPNSAIWQGFDRLGDRHEPARKIWLNTYLRELATGRQEEGAPPIGQARADLHAALAQIGTLAARMGLGDWAEAFSRASALLGGGGAVDDELTRDFKRYAGYSDEQCRLLAAAAAGSVFGAMGSWNDIVPDGKDAADYERASDALFAALNRAVCALADTTLDL